MKYTIVLSEEFDKQLFDECYTDSGIDVTNFFNTINLNTLNFDATKAVLSKGWTDKLANLDTTSFKICNHDTNVAMGYGLGKLIDNHYVIYYILYKNDPANNKDWVNEFWEENDCSLKNILPKQHWNYYLILSPDTSPLAYVIKQKYNIDKKFMILCVPRYASFETNHDEQQ